MSEQSYCTEIDSLAVGLTRAPQFMGVNIRLFFGNLIVCALISIDAHTVWGIPLFVVLHIAMARLSIKDPDFFMVYVKAFLMTPPVFNRRFWGGVNSYEPW